MTTIHKFPLMITDVQTIDLPNGSIILDAQFQDEQLCLWAWLDTTASYSTEAKKIRIIGTGHPIDNAFSLRHISTVQQKIGVSNLVWHVFVEQ